MKMYLKLARIGMNMEEATVSRWHKKPGDSFQAGEVLYEIETEKINQEIEATADGRMLEICVPEGEDAGVGDHLCLVETQEGDQ